MSEARVFGFLPRWKEELVVTGPGGSLILELPMGILTACLPSQDAFARKAPEWAHGLWPQLHAELAEWCRFNNAALSIEDHAGVWPA